MPSRRNKVGKTRIKLAALLSAEMTRIEGKDIEIKPGDLWQHCLYYRKKKYEYAKWGWNYNNRDATFQVFCYQTMSQCVKLGFRVTRPEGFGVSERERKVIANAK